MAQRFSSWLTDSLHRLYADTPASRSAGLVLLAARGERISAQVGVRCEHNEWPVKAKLSCRADEGLDVRIRRIGYVPVPHHNGPIIPGHIEGALPGYVGDPLFDEDVATVFENETHAFWLTVTVDRNCRPRRRKVRLAVQFGEDGPVQRHELTVAVQGATIQKRRDFPIVQWFYNDSLCDWYKVRPWSAAFWPIQAKYVRNAVEHGQDGLYVPVFTPPTDGVKRPTQLLKVAPAGGGKYRFDWSDVRKYLRQVERCGIRHYEFNHLFTQWGVKHAIRVYRGQGLDEKLLWPPETGATSPTYRNFLAQYLPELEQFVRTEGILDRSFFHLSDEPHGAETRANYAKARAMLRELAPWMKVMDALSEVEFARAGLVDMPIPSIATTMQFVREGIPCWTYYCCGPRGRYVNRLLDTPLSKMRMNGWLFYRSGALGFLHWGYNYWYKSQTRQLIDPFTVSDGLAAPGWAYGDPFEVYPGPDGPIDSVRWEVFAESMQDYALLQTLGVSRDDPLLRPLRDFNDFPFSPAWAPRARTKLFAR